MRALAAYIMRGQPQAMIAVTACASLALVLLPLSWPLAYLSAAGVGLVTLVQGSTEGGKTLLGAILIQVVIGLLVLGSPALALVFALSLWLPAWILSSVMRATCSLVLPMQVLLVLGLLSVILAYVIIGDPAAWWYNHVVNEVIPTLEKANIDFQQGSEFEQRLVSATKLMTGVLVMISVWGMMAGLLVARWWQAQLYRPGAFAEEFSALSLGRIVAMFGILLAVLAMFAQGLLAELASNLLLVMIGLLLLQGLAIVHTLVARFKAHNIWLVMLYMMLVFFMPYMLLMVAIMGLMDNWLDFRKRFQAPT